MRNCLHIIIRCCCIITLCTGYLVAEAISTDTSDTNNKFKIRFVLGFDGRSSFITYHKPFYAHIGGIRFGLEAGNLRAGMGFYALSTDYLTQDTTGSGDVLTYKLSFGYFSYFAEYLFYKKKRWEFSLPMYIGYGSSGIKVTSQSGVKEDVGKRPILLLEAVGACQFKLRPWIGIGTGIGYRKMVINNNILPGEFSSFIYIVKVKLFLSAIFKKEKEDPDVKIIKNKSNKLSR